MLFKVHEDQDMTEYMDFESIQEVDVGVLEVEELQDFQSPRSTTHGLSFQSIRVRSQYNPQRCQRRTMGRKACSDPMGGGEVVLEDSKQTDWVTIPSDSTEYDKMKALDKAQKLGFW
ncbi:MAG: surface-adhesin E family protein [Burkholderiaceae bacterium]